MRSIVILVARVGHAQQTAAIELEARMKLVGKGSTVVDSTHAAGSGTSRVTTLDNEARNQTVEDCAIVVAIETVLEKVT